MAIGLNRFLLSYKGEEDCFILTFEVLKTGGTCIRVMYLTLNPRFSSYFSISSSWLDWLKRLDISFDWISRELALDPLGLYETCEKSSFLYYLCLLLVMLVLVSEEVARMSLWLIPGGNSRRSAEQTLLLTALKAFFFPFKFLKSPF